MSDDETQTPPMATRTYAVLAGFDFQDPRSPGHLAPLRGMVNDAFAWWRLLRSMGVSGRHVAILTDRPRAEIAERLQREGLADPERGSDRVLLEEGLFEVWSADDVERALEAFVERAIMPVTRSLSTALDAVEGALQTFGRALRAPTGRLDPFARITIQGGTLPGTRLFVAWSGHGRAVDRGGGPYPSVFTPNGDHVTLADLLVRANAAFSVDLEPGDPPRVVAFVGACNSATALVPRGETLLTSDTFGIPTLAASADGLSASEIEVDGVWRGAMAWAATTVMSRFRPEPGGGISLTYAELIHRMRNLLTAIDVDDEPLLFVPTGELNRSILRRVDDEMLGVRTAEDGQPLEVYPVGGYRVLRPGEKTELAMLYVTDRDGRPYPKHLDVKFPHAHGMYLVARATKGVAEKHAIDAIFAGDFELTTAGMQTAELSRDLAAVHAGAAHTLAVIQKPWHPAPLGSTTDASHRLDILPAGATMWRAQHVFFERRKDGLHFFADVATPSTVSVVPLYDSSTRIRFRRFGDSTRPQRLKYRYRALDVPAD